MLTHLGLTPSFGFGDRLGLATPGHIAAVQGTDFAPIFAQQSVRENARTGRTPLQVMNDAKRAVDSNGMAGTLGCRCRPFENPGGSAALCGCRIYFFHN